MKFYLLDTSVYGVLADPHESDYKTVVDLIEYTKKHRENFLTTFIVAKELHSEKIDKRIRDIILPDYYCSISDKAAPLEIVFASEYQKAKKLAWNYIQKLEKRDADKVMYDALNYAWASIAKVDVFVTRNRRGMLAKDYRKILEKSNRKMKLPFVKIRSPTEFYSSHL